jgi:hypothetical protein
MIAQRSFQHRLAFVFAAALGTAVAGVFVLDAAPVATTSAATQPTSRGAITPAFAAMDYYDQSCAKCHGPGGSFYGPTLGNDLTDDGLIDKCKAMAVGPGNAPLTDAENAVETAYHRSLILRSPFLSITSITLGQWDGEVTDGAKVTIQLPNQTIEAQVTGFTWTARIPADTDPAIATLQAQLNGKTTTLKPARSSYSHTASLPPADHRPK